MNKRRTAIDSVFDRAGHQPWSSMLVDSAQLLAQSYGLAAMDAIHIAVAVAAGADEFVSGEKPGKPMFRVKEIAARSLWEQPITRNQREGSARLAIK
jgi:predicted nucleic acid-binding protein